MTTRFSQDLESYSRKNSATWALKAFLIDCTFILDAGDEGGRDVCCVL